MTRTRLNIAIAGDSSDRLEILRKHLEIRDRWMVMEYTFDELKPMRDSPRQKGPDLIVIDLTHYQGVVISLVEKLRSIYPKAKLIALHFYKNPRLVDLLLKAGLNGYLYADPNRQNMLSIVDRIVSGEEAVVITNADTRD